MQRKSAFKAVLLAIAVFVMSVSLSACGLFPQGVPDRPEPGTTEVKVTLNKSFATILVGETTELTATASDGSEIEWFSGDDEIATVDEDGNVLGVSAGTVKITATCGKALATCAVTVENVPEPSKPDIPDKPEVPGETPTVTISKRTAELNVGETLTLAAAASDGSQITWMSINSSIASVKNGVVTAVSVGNTQIIASCGKATAACDVTVSPLRTVTISKTSLTLTAGESSTLVATASDGGQITWLSDDTAVATVNNGVVTAVSAGNTLIMAVCGKASAGCIVTVNAKPSEPSPDVPAPSGYSLVWCDEFDGNTLDMNKWGYQTGTQDDYYGNKGPTYWGNSELQYYTEGDNVTVSDGILTITARKERRGDRDYTSSRITTRDKASWTFGYMEARMKLPKGNGMWPAFWMLPQPKDHSSSNNEYGGWAANGEIDIMEAKGRLMNKVDTTIHFGGYWPENRYLSRETTLSSDIDEWHTYAVEWTAEYIAWIVDGEQVYKLYNSQWYSVSSDAASAPFDKPFYILFNFAVGGTYDPDGTNAMLAANNFTSADMLVDYVRVYQKSNTASANALADVARAAAPQAIIAKRED